MQILTKKCIVCGKKLITGTNQNKFCSRKCLYIFQDKRIARACLFCRNIGKWKRRFCSPECYSKWSLGKPNQSKTKFKKGLIPWNKGVKPDTEWYAKMRRSGFFNPKFGKDSGNWKGGKTELHTAVIGLRQYKEWRLRIFQRDNWTCQKCKARRKVGDRVVIQVHHLKPFYKIVEENNIKTTKDAIQCGELWNMNNGITLCVSCHRQTESYLVNQYTK